MTLPAGIAYLVIPDAKVQGYLLDLDHTVGGPKARFFLKRGYSRERPEQLAAALYEHAVASATSCRTLSGATGDPLLLMEGPFVCPDGSEASLRVVWTHEVGSDTASLVTAYPLRRPRGPDVRRP